MQDGPIVRLKCKRKLRVTETVSFKMAFQPEVLVEAENHKGEKVRIGPFQIGVRVRDFEEALSIFQIIPYSRGALL